MQVTPVNTNILRRSPGVPINESLLYFVFTKYLFFYYKISSQMRLISVFIFLLFAVNCHTWTCQGTCRGMDHLAQGLGATCTKSTDCLILTCGTPTRASQYGVVAKPIFQIYPCTNPVTLNLQINASFLGQHFTENKNFTGDSSFPESMTFFGKKYTVWIHVALRQMTGQIQFGMTATFGSKTYTVIPQTDIPIDKSSCQGVSHTTHNPLCFMTTPTPTQTGTETKSMVIPITTKSIITSNGAETHNENSTIVISQNNNQQLVIGAISGSVVVVVVVVLIISIITTLVVVYFIIQRRRKITSSFRYSDIKDEL